MQFNTVFQLNVQYIPFLALPTSSNNSSLHNTFEKAKRCLFV